MKIGRLPTLSLELSQKLCVSVVQKFTTSNIGRSALAASAPRLLPGVLSVGIWGSSSTPFHSSDTGYDFLFLQKTPLHTLLIDTFHRELLQTQIKTTWNLRWVVDIKYARAVMYYLGRTISWWSTEAMYWDYHWELLSILPLGRTLKTIQAYTKFLPSRYAITVLFLIISHQIKLFNPF